MPTELVGVGSLLPKWDQAQVARPSDHCFFYQLVVYRAPQIPAVLKGHKYCLHLPSPCRVQRLLWPVAKRTSQTMGCWTDFCMHWSNRGLRSCGTHPNRQKQTPQRPDHVPLWLHLLFCLPTCRSVPRGQKSAPRCKTPCLGGRVERPGLEHRTAPSWPARVQGCPCWGGLPPTFPAAQASQG